ncbi:ribosome maturation factor RimM [Ornithinibacillus gellani]|uniref:ribosome maturation factor RimM n=1 Tax=Ornithinibacillus gellani TaxID=2293253 RepID=UPI000F4629A9|nr:ribosome maturation factor RimM [Ornithinibacillus gellani]TQS75581.1 ribosome maturation factor RimM [Ornithinibacillus gellani]
MQQKYYNVGKIINTHGIRGEVKVYRITDFEDRFQVGSKLLLANDRSEPVELEITSHRVHKGFDLLKFKGYNNVNDVESFKGLHLQIAEAQQTALEQGEYYYREIIGCTVFTNFGEQIGEITEILSPGANDVWVVKRLDGSEVYIPYIEDVVKDVDVHEKKVMIELMEGLLE